MKKVRIIFYVTPFKWRYLVQWKQIKKYIVNWLISMRTLSKYSHCEVWTLKDQDPRWVDPWKVWDDKGWKARGTCWTSTMRDKDNGTVKRDASGVLIHPENWRYIELELSDYQYKRLIKWMDFEVGLNRGYSKWDILKFISPIHFPDNKRNICSEFVGNALFVMRIFVKWGIISPDKVHKKLTKLGHKTHKLKG